MNLGDILNAYNSRPENKKLQPFQKKYCLKYEYFFII